LAQQLYECVDCAHQDRASTDWFCAENFVRSSPFLVGAIVCEFVGSLAREHKHAVLPATLYMEYEAFERLCGLTVWKTMFQRLKLELQYPYTRIRFG
jgi:hypothetical protein